MKRIIGTLALILTISFAHAQKEGGSSAVLKADIYTKSSYKKYLKENHLTEERIFSTTIDAGKNQIYLKSDDTYAYKLIVEVHNAKGIIKLISIPISGIAISQGEEIALKLQENIQEKKKWTFSIPVAGKNFHHSEVLEMPKGKSGQTYIYTFTSNNMGKTWRVNRTK